MPFSFEALEGTLTLKVGEWLDGLRKADSASAATQSKITKSFDRIKESSRSLVEGTKQIAEGLGVLATSAAAVSAKLIFMSSNAEEAASKFKFVFKSAADLTGKTMDEFGAKVGRSIFKLRDFAASFGGMLEPLGFGIKQTGAMSAQLSKLAVDLSSFFNISEDRAMEALQAGLMGEYRALRQFGVAIGEDIVQQEALRTGLAKTADEVQGAIRVQTIYNLIMRQTATAQGDAYRTQNSFANQWRRFKDLLFDTATIGGQVLMPFASRTLKLFSAMLGPIRAAAEGLRTFAAGNEALIAGKADAFWTKFAAGVDMVWSAGVRVAGMMSWLTGAVSSVIQAGAPLVGWLQRIFGMLPAGVQDMLLFGGALGGAATAITMLAGQIPIIGPLIGAVMGLVNPLKYLNVGWSALRLVLAPLLPLISSGANLLLGLLNPVRLVTMMFSPWKLMILPTIKLIGAALAGLFSPVSLAVAAIAALVAAVIYAYRNSEPFKRMVDTIAVGIGKGLFTAVTWCGEKLMWLGGLFLDFLLPKIETVADWLGNTFFVVLDTLKGWFESIGKSTRLLGDLLVRAFRAAIDGVKSSIKSLVDSWAWALEKMASGMERIPGYGADIAKKLRGDAADLRALYNAATAPAAAPANAGGGGGESPGGGGGGPAQAGGQRASPQAAEQVLPAGKGGAAPAAAAANAVGAAAISEPDIKKAEERAKQTQSSIQALRNRLAVLRGAQEVHEQGTTTDTYSFAASELGYGASHATYDRSARASASVMSKDQIFAEIDRLTVGIDRMQSRLDREVDVLEGLRNPGAGGGGGGPPGGGGGSPGGEAPRGRGGLSGLVSGAIAQRDGVDPGGAQIDAAAMKKAAYGDIQAQVKAQREAMGQSMRDMKAKASRAATPAELQQLEGLRRQALASTQAINGTYGAQRDAAVKAAMESQAAYNKAFELIATRGKQSFKELRDAQRAATNEAKKDAGKLGAAGGQSAASAAADARATNSSGGAMVGALFGQSAQISDFLNGAVGGAFAAGADGQAALQDAMDNATPLQKIDMAIENVKARMAGMQINMSNFGGGAEALNEAAAQLKGLTKQRQQALDAEARQRGEMEHRRQEAYQHREAQKKSEELERRRQDGWDLASAIGIGSQRPIQINVHAHDVQATVDAIEKQLTRRGVHVGVKRQLRTT